MSMVEEKCEKNKRGKDESEVRDTRLVSFEKKFRRARSKKPRESRKMKTIENGTKQGGERKFKNREKRE
jgi:hypothetical protein